MASELAQPSSALLAEVVGDRAEIAAVFGKLPVMKGVALQFTIEIVERCRPSSLAISQMGTLRSLR
jgi:hypothetical protein